nr:hypothetical protein [Tanacetum cinerariifolium]
MNVSSISEAMQPTIRERLERACNQITYFETLTREVELKNPYLIYDYCGGSHEADEWEQNNPVEQVCFSGGDIYDDPSLLRFYQNDDTPPWGNSKRKGNKNPKPEAPTFSITTRSGVSTRDPLFLTPSKPTPTDSKGAAKKEGPEGAEPSITHNEEPAPRPSIFYQPSKSLNLPFPSRVKKQEKDDED